MIIIPAALEKLLTKESSDALARRCLNALGRQPRAEYKATDPIPLDEIRHIYARRAALNRKRQGTVEGFDELEPALQAETGDSVVVHGFQADDEAYTVFTNPDVTKLVGILVSHPNRGQPFKRP